MVLRERIAPCAHLDSACDHPDSVCSECDSECAVRMEWEAGCRIRPMRRLRGRSSANQPPRAPRPGALVSPPVSPPVPLT
eukprot:5197244-Prymnesium_polylepis.1